MIEKCYDCCEKCDDCLKPKIPEEIFNKIIEVTARLITAQIKFTGEPGNIEEVRKTVKLSVFR
jgi:hypothetical protein